MKLAIEISDSQAEKLKDQANALAVGAEELATAAVQDLLAAHDKDFQYCSGYWSQWRSHITTVPLNYRINSIG